MLSQLACEVAFGVAMGVFETSGVDVSVPGPAVSVISGVLVDFGVDGDWGVPVSVGLASTVCVCRASAVDAICVKIEAVSTVGVATVFSPPQADRASKGMADRSQNNFAKRFIFFFSPNQSILPSVNTPDEPAITASCKNIRTECRQIALN
jgi:hypothetical protein